jgi:hypothetical protein
MVTLVVSLIVVALVFALVIAVARDPGPGPNEVATAYELAWDRLDFDALWTLSGSELRDGRLRRAFITDKRNAYAGKRELRGLAARVELEAGTRDADDATIVTRVELRDGGVMRNQLRLARRDGRWLVTDYTLQPDVPTPDPSAG